MLQYIIAFSCVAASGGCVSMAPPIPDAAQYASDCLAMAEDKDGAPDDKKPQGVCTISQDDSTGVVVVTVKGNTDGYFIMLPVQAPDPSDPN